MTLLRRAVVKSFIAFGLLWYLGFLFIISGLELLFKKLGWIKPEPLEEFE